MSEPTLVDRLLAVLDAPPGHYVITTSIDGDLLVDAIARLVYLEAETKRLHGEVDELQADDIAAVNEVREVPSFSYWWKFVHNAVIHPLLAFPWCGPRWLERAHDWTAERCRGAG